MATVSLTPRQQRIKQLLDGGKTPPEIAKQLKITDNAVYQHMRRMRDKTNGSAPARNRARSRSRSRTRGARAAVTAASAPAAHTPAPAHTPSELRDMTPLQAIRARKGEIEAQLRESGRRAHAARKAAEDEAAAHERLVANRREELGRLESAEGALTGKPTRKRQRNRKAAAKAPQTPQEPASAPVAPDNGTAPAEPQATQEPPAQPVAVGGPGEADFSQEGSDDFGEE